MLTTSYVLRRVFFALVTIYVSVTLNFFLFRVLKGGPLANFVRVPNTSPELQERLAVQFGLDKPLWQQYLSYLRNLIHGDMGISFAQRQPVTGLLLEDLRNTVILVAAGTLLAILLGTTSGVLSAWRRGTPGDHANAGLAMLAYAVPSQWLGLVILIIFAGVLPSAGMSDPFVLDTPSALTQALDVAKHMILPTLTLTLTGYGSYMLVVRASMLESLGEDYILTARAKGLPPGRIVLRHATRNAMLPMVTQVALDVGYVVGGAILVEVIFSWPGIGQAVYLAIGQRDYPMLQGGFLMLTVAVVVMNLVADLVYFRLDPRVTA